MSTSKLSTQPAGTATSWHYTTTARLLHWSLALLLAGQIALGWTMMAFEDDPGSAVWFGAHKSIGLVIAALVVIRILWRASHPRAPLPTTVPVWQRTLAVWTQALLYLLMVAMPIAGYVGASYSKYGVAFFGLPTPRWAAPDHDVAERWFAAHGILAWVLVALVALHLAGAMKHLLVDRDGVFRRMWAGRKAA